VSANEELLDAQIRHSIYVQRFGGSQINRFIALLNRADGELVDVINTRIARIAERGYDTGPDTTKRLEKVLASIRELNIEAYGEAGRELTKTLAEFAVYERDWNIAQIEQPLPVAVNVIQPAAELVTAAALKRPFQGRLLKEWLSGVEEARAVRVRDAIRLGLVEGEPIDKMVRRIRGTRAAGYQDGLLEIDRRGAAAMVRTAVNHTSNAARNEVMDANESLIKAVRWVATLDGRTTPICQSRDGKLFPVKSGPRPPAHIGCRSTTVPVLKSFRDLGIDVDDAPAGTRASLNGQVPADLTYEQWLRKQPGEFQDEVLGKAKGALFRTGKVSLDRFVDGSGKELSLKQLQKAEPVGFTKAGLNNPIRPPRGQPQDAIARFLASPSAQQKLVQEFAGQTYTETVELVRSVKAAEGWTSGDQSLAAVRIYTGPQYKKINAEARRGDEGALKARQFTALTSSALPGMEQYAGPIWRSPTKTPENAEKWWSSAVIGELLDTGKSLQSFSAVAGEAAKFSESADVLFKVSTPKTGASVSKISFYPKEAEVLLPPGLAYRVVSKGVESVDRPGFGERLYRIIELEIVDVDKG